MKITLLIFKIRVSSVKNNIDYNSSKLNLNFLETKQYNPSKWIKKYLDFLIGYGNSIWATKYEDYNGYFPYEPLASYKNEEQLNGYFLDNIKYVLDHISLDYTETFSSDSANFSMWFYEEKKIKVKAIKYEYLGKAPYNYAPNGGIRAKVHLFFEYFNDPTITTESDVEIWMKLRGFNLEGDKLW